MTKRTTFKIIVDVLMMAALLLLMTYNLIGDAFHEWVGTGMLALFILHHILNRKWLGAVFCGKYPPYRILQTSLVLLVFLAMLGSMVSGILLSRYVFSFLPVGGGVSFARTLHLVCGYWNLVLMSLHLGLHWNMMLNMGKRLCKKPSVVRAWALRVLGIAIAVCGAVLFWQEGIPGYLFLQTQFVFLDYSRPFPLYLLTYLAIAALFVFLGHYLAVGLRRFQKAGKQS